MAHLPDDESITALFSRLFVDVRTFARAEAEMYRAQVMSRLDDAKGAIVLLLISVVLANAAIIALLVGLLMVLNGPVGPGWATVIVVGGTLLIVGILTKVAIGRLGKTAAVTEKTT